MFADLLMPPTLVFDWVYLGPTFGLMAFLFVVAGLIVLFIELARRGVAKPRLALMCMFLFVMADLVIYFVGINLLRPRERYHQPPTQSQKDDQPAKPSE